jgi:putative hydrolase of the HAD superfamily
MTWPNKLPLPTPASGTPAVGAPVAPTSGAADFSMKDSGAAAIVETKKAVIFDLFHTLTSLESTLSPGRRTTSDMLGVSQEAWNDQLLKKSRDRLVGSKKDAFEIIAGMARAIDRSISDEKIKAATENRIAQFAAALTAIPAETITVLGSLKKREKRIGLISNADVMEVAAWGKSKIGHFFDSTVFSCAVGCVKPEREIYEISLRELGVSPDEAVFVGDGGSNELEGAKKIGMATIMMTGIIKSLWPEQIADRRRHADFVIEQLNELTFSTSQEAHMP